MSESEQEPMRQPRQESTRRTLDTVSAEYAANAESPVTGKRQRDRQLHSRNSAETLLFAHCGVIAAPQEKKDEEESQLLLTL